ncbi:MAG: glycosyltransferase [Bacteroidota bacterium]
MPEEKKKKIVIASVLKPVNDSRMFEKIGISLALSKSYEIHIIGFPASTVSHPSIQFHSLPYFKRLSLARVLAPWRILKKILYLQPDLLIITTHELLVAGFLTRIFTGCKLIYDIQENYYRNLLYSHGFPPIIRTLLALYVRAKETLSPMYVNYFFLAEMGYVKELTFPQKRMIILENKTIRTNVSRTPGRLDEKIIKLLFTGTLAPTTGVFTAIELATKLHHLDPRIQLTIAGYCAQPAVLRQIKKAIGQYTHITLVGGDVLVPHERILNHIRDSHFGIIAYPKNPSTENSIPTKLYEYLGNLLPILLIDHQPWQKLCEPYRAAVVFDADRIDAHSLLHAMKNQAFYPSSPTEVFWDNEAPKLLQTVAAVLP